MKRRFLFEADDDANAAGGTPDAGGDAAATDTTADTSTPDDAGDAGNNDNTNPDDDGIQDPGNGDEDFSIDSTPDDNFGADDNNDTSTDTGSSSSSSGNDDDEPTVSADSLKAKDGKLFEDLEPAEQELKLKELKEQYINLYQTCDGVIDKLNSLSKEYEEINDQLKRVVNILFTTKKMIADYLLHIFDSKSYIENDIQYNNYLSVLNSVKNIIKDYKNSYKDTNSTA